MVKKGYCGNESLDLAWDRMEVHQVGQYRTTDLSKNIKSTPNNTKKKLTNMIIYIGTNDAPNSRAREIQDNLLKLKSLAYKKLPHCKIWYQPHFGACWLFDENKTLCIVVQKYFFEKNNYAALQVC